MERIKASQKEVSQILSGATFIILTFIANGILSFVSMGFDWALLKTTEYWARYFTLFLSEMSVMFGMYLIQRVKDLNKKVITDLQTDIDNNRNKVYKLSKVAEAERWLNEIYNYREKLTLFEDKLKELHSKATMTKPKEGSLFYNKKIKKFNKLEKKQEYYLAQLKLVDKDKERIKFLLEGNKEKALELQNELYSNLDYAFYTAKIKYREVMWGDLQSGMGRRDNHQGDIFFSEEKAYYKNVMKSLGYGIITSSFFSAIIFPSYNELSSAVIINIFVTMATLCFFMIKGVAMSQKNILGGFCSALEKRKMIYSQMAKDIKISNIVIVEKE